MNNKKLFVAGLSYDLNQDAFAEHFGQAGQVVSAVIIMDKFSGRSKGFGFVEYATTEEAQKAIQMFNDTEFAGRKIIVNEARPQEDRPRSGGGGFSRGNDNRGGSRHGHNDRNNRGGNDRGNRW
ncbi:MAG TPA: RNA-binding protein [Patescibacteria group bacterium]|nr:RNA-binding protein [Patescibacteria group bacterium]